MSSAGPSAIRLEAVSYRYPGATTDALHDVTLDIGGRDFVGVVGPNGGGKTTLLEILLGWMEPQQGRVEVLGQSPARVRAQIGYVPQHATVDSSIPADVLDIVLMGRLSPSSWGPWFRRRDREAAEEALERVEAADLTHEPWWALSGGQRQRILIARALVADIELLLLDEPTTGVDTHREHELLDLLHRLNERMPIVMVSHDLALVSSHTERAVWVDRGVVAAPSAQLTVAEVERLLHGRRGTSPRRGETSR